MRVYIFVLWNIVMGHVLQAQGITAPCTHEALVRQHLEINPNYAEEASATERALEEILQYRRKSINNNPKSDSSYIIPVVLHVFHHGEDGRIDTAQAQSGLDILNNDLIGNHDGWDSIDATFDSIKATINLSFRLAQLDPDGQPTTGILYHDDASLMNNDGDLFEFAWDNSRYLNIYLPKYIIGKPSDFTAFAYYPSVYNIESNRDGIIYSSIRWGLGAHSELEEGDDWLSVITHEVGHWLNLRHTFEGGCDGEGDGIDDTPPTLADGPAFEGCYNQDYSCGVRTNGENYMDYNHRCKKMFTRGQVERMEAALYLPSRRHLWSADNLAITGIVLEEEAEEIMDKDQTTALFDAAIYKRIAVYPNPANDYLTLDISDEPHVLSIYTLEGKLFRQIRLGAGQKTVTINNFPRGLYGFTLKTGQEVAVGRFVVER